MTDVEAEDERSTPLANVVVALILAGLVIAPPLLAWYMDDSRWLFGWVILLILGLAG